jgi:hypothetical protein
MPTLLGTKDGIAALSSFLTKSGAFSRTGTTPTKPTQPLLANEPEPDRDEVLVYDDGG